MLIRRWKILLITIALWLSVGIFLKRIDFELFGEAKTFLTILFGWATSFLFLSFIWLLQKKPLHGSWTGLGTGDSPSMHPRGRIDSVDLNAEADQRRATICTVASLIDKPPNYEDALIYSKPIYWTYQPMEKAINNCQPESTSAHIIDSNTVDQTTSGDCCIFMNDSNKINDKSSTSVTQLALAIVRGFTNLEPNQQTSHIEDIENTQYTRKISYSQLDAYQLISESPPKYKELNFGGITNDLLSNNSNEPAAG